MSSMVSQFARNRHVMQRMALSVLLLGSVTTCYAASADSTSSDWAKVRDQLANPTVSTMQVNAAISEWRRLSQNDRLPFTDYAAFLIANPGWPGEDKMRRVAEQAIDPNTTQPAIIVSYFAQYPPKTNTGFARHAMALAAFGRTQDALAAARAAWTGGAIPLDDEARLLGLYAGNFTAADHAARADALLWAKGATAAERVLPYIAADRRPVFEARIAFQRKSADAAIKMQMADALGAGDAGYLADKAGWLRDSGNSMAARTLLANRQTLAIRPGNPDKWFESLLTNARAAANDTQWSLAYGIVARIDDAYAPGVQVRDQSLGERDKYTSLTWLAGTIAFYQQNRPREAAEMFQRYALAARTPQTQSKGYYWAGRAAQAAGDRDRANAFYAQAGGFPDQFYGQLALERMGKPIPPLAGADSVGQPSAADRATFYNRGVVRAVQTLGEQGLRTEQSLFLRAIAASAVTDMDHVLAGELSRTLGRPDLGVMAGRRAASDGLAGYGTVSFPRIAVPEGHQGNWTMIHAIARQESQFDRTAISHAGARGIMQLMPGTARETAGRIGLSYMPSALTEDPSYNIKLGSTYFQQMLNYYGGSYPLAVAAYNAGPGNVNKWLKANGDPRMGGMDIIKWIEDIPIFETRNYVQRVLENAVVYDLMHPGEARYRNKNAPLSHYLGKSQPG